MASPDIQLLRRDLLRLLGLPAVLFAGLLAWWQPWVLRPYTPRPPQSVFDVAAGVWDWDHTDSTCLRNPVRVDFSPSRDTMYIMHAQTHVDSTGRRDSLTTYRILEHSGSHIRGQILGEDRRTPDGALLELDLVLTSSKTYVWHRADWQPTETTKRLIRCPLSTAGVIPPRPGARPSN